MIGIRIAVLSASIAASWFAGRFTAFLVWMFIYSIGARVVSDQTHYQLYDSVIYWGGVAGVAFALTIIIQMRRVLPVILSLAAGQVLATVAGFIGGASDWKLGVAAYFGAYVLFALSVPLLASFTRRRKSLCGRQISA
jgi:hypothetical protein